MKKISVIICTIFFGITMNSCKKSAPQHTSAYSVRLTDDPGPYNAVYIDLQGVEITGNDGKAVLINTHSGIYNLLNYSNGMDTLIASGNLGITSVQQIRLILGPNNSVVVGNVSYPLSTPSADQSGLKLQVHQTLQAGINYNVLLDFDANKSIVLQGNGSYKLKPVIRTIEIATGGSITGKISQAGTLAYVTATSGATYTSNVSATGEFLLMGLPAGTYSVTITPALPLNPVTENNIIVTTGVSTNIGTITL